MRDETVKVSTSMLAGEGLQAGCEEDGMCICGPPRTGPELELLAPFRPANWPVTPPVTRHARLSLMQTPQFQPCCEATAPSALNDTREYFLQRSLTEIPFLPMPARFRCSNVQRTQLHAALASSRPSHVVGAPSSRGASACGRRKISN